jgi:hypothetical protein
MVGNDDERQPKQTVLATACVGILVAIAFFAAHAGQTFSQADTAPCGGLYADRSFNDDRSDRRPWEQPFKSDVTSRL